MPAPISMRRRQQLQALRQQGATLTAIAESLQLPFWTVRKLCRQFRDQQGEVVVVVAPR